MHKQKQDSNFQNNTFFTSWII